MDPEPTPEDYVFLPTVWCFSLSLPAAAIFHGMTFYSWTFHRHPYYRKDISKKGHFIDKTFHKHPFYRYDITQFFISYLNTVKGNCRVQQFISQTNILWRDILWTRHFIVKTFYREDILYPGHFIFTTFHIHDIFYSRHFIDMTLHKYSYHI